MRASMAWPRGWRGSRKGSFSPRSEEHTSELQSQSNIVCRLLLEIKNGVGVLLRGGHIFRSTFLGLLLTCFRLPTDGRVLRHRLVLPSSAIFILFHTSPDSFVTAD